MKIPFTREHGAYGMAITSFVIGAGVGGTFRLWTLTTLIAIILFIMAKFPLSILLQGREIDKNMKRQFILWSFIFLYTGFLLSLPLMRVLPAKILILTGISVGIHLLLYFLFIVLRKERAILAEVIGIGTICLSGVFGFFSSGGEVIKDAVFIYLLPLLYYTASIFKVRSLVLKEGREFFRKVNFLYPFFCGIIVFILAIMNLLEFSVLLSLLPLLENISANLKTTKVDIRKVGWVEVAKASAFGLILIFTLR